MEFVFPAGILGALTIFLLRVVDVTLGTIRAIYTVKGHSVRAGAISFIEVTIFVVAISQVLRHMDTIWHVLGYSGGFAAGTILGGLIERKMALGHYLVSVHCHEGWKLLVGELRAEGFGVTEFTAEGKDGPVHVVETLVLRRDFPRAMDVISATTPDAFVHSSEQNFIRRGYINRLKRK